ncbi:MAG: glutathione synthase [Desulfobacterales bacterium]|nr:glutathione synthase [Desulfobacterales bacterium]
MIVSFHPCIEGDRNITCAGRSPNNEDLKAIKAAHAVILSQGCSRVLYEMASNHCGNVFPNLDGKFRYPGKTGQIELFQKNKAPHPKTETFRDIHTYTSRYGGKQPGGDFSYPFVFKFSWGGEGESVHLIRSADDLDRIMQQAIAYERSGLKGFLLQECIPADGKTLRVVVVGQTIVSYWRVQHKKERFYSSLAKGAVVDAVSDSIRRKAAERAVKQFCTETGINLAGFDLIFSTLSETEKDRREPLFLEINYFFGRKGLGGSEKFYALLRSEVEKWLAGLGKSLTGC